MNNKQTKDEFKKKINEKENEMLQLSPGHLIYEPN